MTDLAIPAGPGDLTAKWLSEALRSSAVLGDGTVTTFDTQIIGEGVGIMGQLARVSLQYEGGKPSGPPSLVAKFPTPVAENRAVAQMFGFYEKEVRFYQEVAAAAPVGTASCYYAAFEPSSGEFVLLMEDLADARPGDQTQGCTPEEAELAVREIARMHAAWWDDGKLDGLRWLPSFTHPMYMQGLPGTFQQAWMGTVQNFGSHLPPNVRSLGDRFHEAIPDMLRRLARPPHTFVHGDYRLDNFFFRDGTGDRPLAIVDWQICGRGRGPYDVGYFLSQSLDPKSRRMHERDIVQAYYDALVAGGVREYSMDDCWEDYRLATLHCLIYPVVVCGATDVGNERGLRLATAILERSVAAIEELNAYDLITS
ncbi:MAG: phosphotransferase [Dehalococcoidia bacterium]